MGRGGGQYEKKGSAGRADGGKAEEEALAPWAWISVVSAAKTENASARAPTSASTLMEMTLIACTATDADLTNKLAWSFSPYSLTSLESQRPT